MGQRIPSCSKTLLRISSSSGEVMRRFFFLLPAVVPPAVPGLSPPGLITPETMMAACCCDRLRSVSGAWGSLFNEVEVAVEEVADPSAGTSSAPNLAVLLRFLCCLTGLGLTAVGVAEVSPEDRLERDERISASSVSCSLN